MRRSASTGAPEAQGALCLQCAEHSHWILNVWTIDPSNPPRAWTPARRQSQWSLVLLYFYHRQTKVSIAIVPRRAYSLSVPVIAEPVVLPDLEQDNQTGSKDSLEPGYLVICWNDPVNLMVYVTHVFQVVFGWPRQKAERHMLQVHNQGKSLLVRESLEKAEHYVHQLQHYSLHATMERD
jgi:ATP-dependent Clp protease adaptor protein ClpS